MPAIKICGLTRPDDAREAVDAGADYLGVILAGGPRLLDVTQARRVLGAARHEVRRVAVFGAQSVDETREIAEALALDAVQLHGDPSEDFVRQLRDGWSRAIWPVLRVEGTSLPASAAALARAAGHLVLDAKVVGQLGGTGVALDWGGLRDEVAAVRAAVPDVRIVLAGGLRAENVRTAIGLLAPDVVDISSGVEVSPGVKDPVAIQQFVAAVRAVTR